MTRTDTAMTPLRHIDMHGARQRADKMYSVHTAKGKAIPLQAWTEPEGSSRLRLPDFKIHGT